MGVDLADIIPRAKTSLDDLKGKTFAVDAYNALYQFLAIIRGPTGTPLMDRNGRVTSHLSGLLYRTTNLAERGIRLVYVFDGVPPALKEVEIKRRRAVKEEAIVKYEAAVSKGQPKKRESTLKPQRASKTKWSKIPSNSSSISVFPSFTPLPRAKPRLPTWRLEAMSGERSARTLILCSLELIVSSGT